jgi:Ca-activated chloride channel family protein
MANFRPFRAFPLLLAAGSLLVGLQGAAAGQTPGGAGKDEPSAEFSDSFSVGYVLVPVVVRDGARYVQGLDRKDFLLRVDGRPAAFESFESRADAPASLVLLQDLSGSMEAGERMTWSRNAAKFFLDQAASGDEFAIASFSDGEQRIDIPFTDNLGALREAIQIWKPWGKTALHDAVAHMPEISGSGHNPKRFALLITDGVDNASSITPDQAREMVRAAQVPVYVLGLDSGSPYSLDDQGKKVYRYADVLNLLAATSGGRYFSVSSTEELNVALAAIREDLRHQYVLGFATGDGSDRFRRLEIQVPGKRAVLFRRGYTGPPPAAGVGR